MTENTKLHADASVRDLQTMNQGWINRNYQFDQCPQMWGPTRLFEGTLF
jgi:hypothetical protein